MFRVLSMSLTDSLDSSAKYSQDNPPPWNMDFLTIEYDEQGEIDVGKLLDNMSEEQSSYFDDLNTDTLRTEKLNSLGSLGLSEEILLDWMTKLEKYRFVDELQQLQMGRYIRWVPTYNMNELRLTKGGFICGIYIEESGIEIEVVAHRRRVSCFRFDNAIIFQHLSKQEEVIMSLMNYLEDEDGEDDK